MATPFGNVPLVISGALKAIYDLTLLISVQHIKPPEEQVPQ
jgi:hypothetical protein